MKAADAAKLVRKAIKRTGYSPKGKVYVRNHEMFTELRIDLSGLTRDAVWEVEQEIRQIPDGDFTWEVEG